MAARDQHIVVSYDIHDPKRLARVAKTCATTSYVANALRMLRYPGLVNHLQRRTPFLLHRNRRPGCRKSYFLTY